MALKLKSSNKDIKKSSYYVWFLGAKESKGLRGSEYIIPVIKHLEEREKDVEPFKVTLQISHKGLKIIQNIVSQNKSKPKNETIKHFIPHNTITCVYQSDDIIACILLLFNPVTKCPLHVHAYRCDSVETATILKQQLQQLIEKPENQKKFNEIESKLKREKKVESSIGSDTGTTSTSRESESSDERFSLTNDNNNINSGRITTLYDSVAAELREKLNKNNVPILLPPRDYDTVHRQKGNLTGIDLRRCLNANIVGQNAKSRNRRIESSGGSSGIGSDHPPSPESPDNNDSRYNTLDRHHHHHHHNTSDEEDDWNGDPADTTLYMVQGAHVTLPRPAPRSVSPPPPPPSSSSPPSMKNHHNTAPPPSTHYNHHHSSRHHSHSQDVAKYLEKPIAKFTDNKYLNRQKSLERSKSMDRCYAEEKFCQKEELERRYHKGRTTSNINNNNNNGNKPVKYFVDDGFDENLRYRPRYAVSSDYNSEPPVPKTRQKYAPSPSPASPRERFKDARQKFQQMEREPAISPSVKPLRRHESMYMYESGMRPHQQQQPPSPPADENNLLRSYKYDPKRRSMFNLIEEEHRKNSNEIAKELKRRSYLGGVNCSNSNNSNNTSNNNKNDLTESDRYEYSKSSYELDKIVANGGGGGGGGGDDGGRFIKNLKNQKMAGFRHSYAEPIPQKLRMEKAGNKRYPEMLQRTNSVSTNGGRVGIASVHPY